MSKLALNAQQASALVLADEWWKTPAKRKTPFLLTGYAGTGKSTLLADIIAPFNPARVKQGAPTGKAARVMERKSKRLAQTLHQILMTPLEEQIKELRLYLTELIDSKERIHNDNQNKPAKSKYLEWSGDDFENEIKITMQSIEEMAAANRKDGMKFGKQSFSALRASTDLLVIDEGSMVTKEMYEVLKETEIPQIVMFDPFQLPPVKSVTPWPKKVDVELTEIMRQGPGSGVVQCSTSIRQGYGPTANDDVRIISKRDHKIKDLAGYDMIITGTNRVRRSLNASMREFYGRSGIPREGDRILCLANDMRVRNGELFTVKDAFVSKFQENVLMMTIEDDDGVVYDKIRAWLPVFDNEEKSKERPFNVSAFTYGYAITCHKAQGSEASKVLVVDDWPGTDHDRWLYTAVTRARDKCTIIKD